MTRRVSICVAMAVATSTLGFAFGEEGDTDRFPFYGGPSGDVDIVVAQVGEPGKMVVDIVNMEIFGPLAMQLYDSIDGEPEVDFCTGGQLKTQPDGLLCIDSEDSIDDDIRDPNDFSCALGYSVATGKSLKGSVAC